MMTPEQMMMLSRMQPMGGQMAGPMSPMNNPNFPMQGEGPQLPDQGQRQSFDPRPLMQLMGGAQGGGLFGNLLGSYGLGRQMGGMFNSMGQ